MLEARIVEVRLIGKTDVVRAFAAQGAGAGQPRVEPAIALHIGAQIGLTLAAGEQGNVLTDAEALLINLAKRVFEVRILRRDIDKAVVTGGGRFQRIQHRMATGGRHHIGQGDAQIRRASEDFVVQGQVDLAGLFAHRFELLRRLRKSIGRAVEPERRFAAALQAQTPDLFAFADRQRQLIELPVGAIGFERQRQWLIIAHALRLQRVDPAMKLAGQHRLFPGATLKYNSSPFCVCALKCTLAGSNSATVCSSCSTR